MTEQDEINEEILYRREIQKEMALSNELVILEDKCFDYLEEFREYNGNRGLMLGERLSCVDVYEFIIKKGERKEVIKKFYKKYKWGYKSVKKDFK